MRSLRLSAVLVVILSVVVMFPGCAAQVGSTSRQTPSQADYKNGSPNTLSLTSQGETWSTNGTGPQRYTFMEPTQVTTFQQGSTPREIMYDRDTGRLVISSGSDINAEGVEFDPKTGAVKVRKFGTSASEPLRAGNESLDRLREYWAARDQASKEAIIAEIKAIEKISPDVKDVLIQLLTGL